MSQRVECPHGVPAWPAIASRLAADGASPQMRMIDGQLAFPDEEPPADWNELRIAIDGMMVTLRRDGLAVEVITWGTAEKALQTAWQAVAMAIRKAGDDGR